MNRVVSNKWTVKVDGVILSNSLIDNIASRSYIVYHVNGKRFSHQVSDIDVYAADSTFWQIPVGRGRRELYMACTLRWFDKVHETPHEVEAYE